MKDNLEIDLTEGEAVGQALSWCAENVKGLNCHRIGLTRTYRIGHGMVPEVTLHIDAPEIRQTLAQIHGLTPTEHEPLKKFDVHEGLIGAGIWLVVQS